MNPTGTPGPSLLISPSSFLATLSYEDLQRLRAHVKRTHMRDWKPEFVTNREADRIIESIGPIAAERCIKEAVDRKWNR